MIPFRIVIGQRDETGGFPVHASSGGLQADTVLELPDALLTLGSRLLLPRADIALEDLEGLGRQLGRALFVPRLRGLLLEQARAAAQHQARLQIQLQIGVPELAALPWEWLAIGSGKPWVPALREDYTLVRVGRQARPAAPIVVDGPIQVLAIGGRGQRPQLEALAAELASAQRAQLLELEALPNATLESIDGALAGRQFQIVHIAAPVRLTSDERLVVELENTVDGFDLADLLAGYPTLRLVTLAGGRGMGEALCAAPALLGAVLMTDQISAAVALSAAIAPEASARFAATLYIDLAEGAPLDLAVTAGRRALFEVDPGAWGVPQLRTLPGADRLFALRPSRATGIDTRRLLPAVLLLAVLVVLLGVRTLAQRSGTQQPLQTQIAGDQAQSFVLPNFPGAPPTATAAPGQPTPTALPAPQTYVAYTVAPSDTLALIGERLGSDARGIAELNGLDPQAPPRVGRGLVVPVFREGAAEAGGLLVARGNPEQPLVALTFDIEIDQASVYSILETLRGRGIKATFFVTGTWVEAYPEAARAIVRDGHELGNHSYNHPYFSRLSYDGAAEELDATERVVREVTGATTRPYFRFPYGDSTLDLLSLAGEKGYIAYHWSTDEAGFDTWLAQVGANPADGNGAILLMHGRSDVAAALPGWLEQIAGLGLRPTTLGEVLR